jgi:serine/threonine protein kinase/ribosomal protein S20
MDNHRNALTPGYKLHWYTIKKILGQGGFGITYLAEDTNLNQSVAIKEFLPIEMAVRDQSASVHPVSSEYGDQFKWGLDRFMSEAQTLAKFKHPNIVRVFTVFPENNTAYMVMEYEHGNEMHKLLKNKATLSEDKLRAIILPILDGLKQVHAAGFIHRDIKPANIFIREDGSPVLLDFGSARQSFGHETHTLTAMVSPGFAPFEQYISKSDKQGPWTDIYGLGATMYRAVIGRSPAEAMDRSEGLLHAERDTFVGAAEIKPEGYSASLLSAIDHALAFKSENRPQSVAEWLTELNPVSEVEQSDVETVIDPGYLQEKLNDADNISIEKTQVLDQEDVPQSKNKPSLLRRVSKYALIGFAVLFVLALLNNGNKQGEKKIDEPVVADNATTVVEAEADKIEQKLADTGSETSNATETIAQLLQQAGEDVSALRLTKPEGNNAVQKYQDILNLDPENVDAKKGLINVAEKYLALSKNNIQSKELDKAKQYLELAKGINPDHPDIATIEKRLSKDIKSIDKELQAAKKLLFSNEDKTRVSKLQARIKDNPKDRAARKEVQTIMKTYESKIKDTIAAGDLDTATAFLREVQAIAPRSIRVKNLLKKIEQKRKN